MSFFLLFVLATQTQEFGWISLNRGIIKLTEDGLNSFHHVELPVTSTKAQKDDNMQS